ncbi:MAG: DNA phosphorothioation-associated protein 4 [Gammaproteobacteria bacterium]|nr:MAG: DNA phosphorothioation-associated protein 4 [Gammaproteobacteria bacterium]
MSERDTDSEEQINWRTIGVKRERKYEELITRLNTGQKSIFQYLKDLMVFAAMVGHSEGKREEVKGETIEIILETYASDQKDGFIYLLALMDSRDGVSLKDSNLHSSVKVFEEYCNAGLGIIQGWLDDNPGDPSGVDTILANVYEKLCENEVEDDVDNEDISIDI